MERERLKAIQSKVPMAKINFVPNMVNHEVANITRIKDDITDSALPGAYDGLDAAISEGRIKVIDEIEREIVDINSEYFRALEIGVDPNEAILRKNLRREKLSLGILLSRRGKGHQFLSGTNVKLFNYPYDGGINSPVANNRIRITIPNSSNPDIPHTLNTRISKMATLWRASRKNPGSNSLVFYHEVLKQQPVEQVPETEDQFVIRRAIEIENLDGIINNGRQSAGDIIEHAKIRDIYLGHLLKIWLRRRNDPQNYENALKLGYGFGPNKLADELQLRITSSRINSITFKFPPLSRWRRTFTRDALIREMEELGISKPADYDFIG